MNSCKIIDTNKFKGLSALQQHFGINQDAFWQYREKVIAKETSTEVIAKPHFANWFKEHYNEDIDFINGNPTTIKNAVLEYYEQEVPSVSSTAQTSDIDTNYINFGYSSASARREAKDYLRGLIASLDNFLFTDTKVFNPLKYLNNVLLNAKSIATEAIDSSLLMFDKDKVKGDIAKAKNIEDIKKILHEVNVNISISANKRSKHFFKNLLLNSLRNELANRITYTSNRSKEDILLNIKKMTKGDMESLLGGDNMSYVDKNYLACYWELNTDTNDDFLNELILSQQLKGIQFNTNVSEDEKADKTRINADEAGDDDTVDVLDNGDDDDNYNSFISVFDHSGIYTNALAHVDDSVRTHLGSLKKLNSNKTINGQPDYNRNNALGVPMGIDVNRAIGMIYHNARFENKDLMIQSIRNIADRFSEWGAFYKLADDLEKNEDLANLYYNTFGKLVITKTITRSNDGKNEFRISNANCDKRTALRSELLNSIKHTVYDNSNPQYWLDRVNLALQLADKSKNLIESSIDNEIILSVIASLTKAVKAYYPTIEESAIKLYINTNKNKAGVVDVIGNIKALGGKIQETIKEAKESLNNYTTYVTRINNLNAFNNRLNQLINDLTLARQKEGISREQIVQDLQKLPAHSSDGNDAFNYVKKYLHESVWSMYDLNSYTEVDVDSYVAEDYLTPKQTTLANEFADLIIDYSTIVVDLNGYNVKGNQSSSIINSSFLTNMIRILQDDVTLEKFGKDRGRSSQYNFSPIMFEHKGATASETTYGLFRKDSNGNVVPTEYAKDLLSISLYDGARDEVTGRSELYYKMTNGDYIASAFINFFDGQKTVNNIKLAGYFMRTPSDAKNNFTVTAPKYDIHGLRNEDGTYNPNHPLFASLKRAFKQEILDMAVAIDNIFMTYDNGLIRRDEVTGEPIFKPGISNKGGENIGCYKNYHYNAKDGVIYKNENGTIKLTGNVFHSKKFIVFDEAKGKEDNIGDTLVQKLFNPLYGGASNTFIQVIKQDGEIVDVKLDQVDAEINAMISDFINKFVADSTTRLETYKENIHDKEINFDNVAEFMLNYYVTYLGFDDIFEGDCKFYVSGQDAFKRTKEVQGSGNPYGSIDFRTIFDREYKEVDSILGTSAFANVGVKMYNQYRAVTIANTKKTGETIGEFKLNSKGEPTSFKKKGVLSQKLYNQFIKEHYSEDEAEAKTFEIMSRYYNPKVNDAQSYITFDEWVRRITRRGQLFKYKPLIDKIVNGEELIGDELTEFVQVQKNFQFDFAYDTYAKRFVPRQIKNAEFVLIPQLVKGTELETVAKLMKKYGIDQLNTEETSKAGKANILEVFDAKTGKLKEDIIEEVLNDELPVDKQNKKLPISKFGNAIKTRNAINFYNYEYLFTQQETVQHVQAENKAGVQIMKKLIDNIQPGDALYDTKHQLIELYNLNIEDSARVLFDRLGIKLGENGNFNLDDLKSADLTPFYDMLKEEIVRRGDDPNMLDFATYELTGIGSEKAAKMPDFLTLVGQTLEQIAQSIFNNNIVRQKLPGFHGPQVTSVGFEDRTIREIAGGKLKTQKSDKLQFHPNGEPYIEIMVTPDFFGFERRHPDGKLKTNEELLDELKAANADEVIGYRIPTEAKYSVAIMKVVGFVDDAYGSTIIVPHDWVAQTGSDFDVDSIYGIQAHTFVDKEGHIQRTPSGKETREERDNGILDCMLEIMRHNNSLEESLLTSNVEDISDAIKATAPKNIAARKNNRSQYNFLDQVDNHADAISGMNLKAISVAWDGLVSIANTVGFYLSPNNVVEVINNETGIHEKLNQFGGSNNNRNYVDKLLTAYSGETSPYEFDAIKSGAIPNINEYTFGVFKFLSGVGVDYKLNLAFMQLPGINRLIKVNDKYNSIYSRYTPNIVNAAIKEIAEELSVETDNVSIDEILNNIEEKYDASFERYQNETSHVVLNDSTIEGIYNEKDEESAKLNEIQTILDFQHLKEAADKLTDISMVLRGDKISAKKSIYETEDIVDKCLSLADYKGITTRDGKSIVDAVFPSLIGVLHLTEDVTDRYIDYKGFLNSNDVSAYPTLCSMMKYATIPSIIINKQLFTTQRPMFTALIDRIQKYNGGFKKLTPKARERFVKYAISSVYQQVFINNLMPADATYDEQELEKRRIMGYISTDNNVEILDVKNPTNEELAEFNKLSPVQKVIFIQQNFKDDNIFNLITTDIFPNNTKGHRMNFSSVSNDIDDSRVKYAEAFYNDNPLVASAALDMMKYAFIVEGYSMRKNGLSQLVSGPHNDCLSEFVPDLYESFDTVFAQNDENQLNLDNLCLDFVRSNSDILNIESHVVAHNDKGIAELNKIGDVVVVHDNEYNKNKIKTYGLDKNKVVKLRFNNKDGYVLYKINLVNNGINSVYILTPLNKLERFEHGEFSVNKKNNIYASQPYYLHITLGVQEITGLLEDRKIREVIGKENINEYKQPRLITTPGKHETKSFDVNNPTEDLYGAADIIINETKRQFSGEVTPSTKGYVINSTLDKYIYEAGKAYGSLQVIKVNEGTDNERYVPVNIWKLSLNDKNKISNLVIKGNKLKANSSFEYKDIVNRIIDEGLFKKGIPFNIFIIGTPVEINNKAVEEAQKLKSASIKENTVENAAFQAYSTVNRMANFGNKSAVQLRALWEDYGIEFNKESINANRPIVIKKTAEFYNELVAVLESRTKNFAKNEETGEWLPINDPRLAPILAEDKALENEFLQTLNLIDSIANSNKAIINLNIKSHDEDIQHALTSIRESVNSLKDNREVLEANEMYAKEILAKRSTNPLINQDFIDIFSGHYSTNWLNSWFSDMLETSNPFAQTLLKKVTDDIYRKDMQAIKRAREFVKFYQDLRKKARAEGMDIDINKFIDENGRMIHTFDNKLVDDLEEKRKAYRDIKAQYEQATDFVTKHNLYKDYLKAKLEYDRFIIDHCEQPLLKEYYEARYELDRHMFYGNPEKVRLGQEGELFGNLEDLDHSDILAEWKRLQSRRYELINIKRKGLLDDQQEQELDDLDKQLRELIAPPIDILIDDELDAAEQDARHQDTTPVEEKRIKNLINAPHAKRAIIHYINELEKINNKYFQYDTEFGFEEELEKNLQIIANRELRDPNGNLRKPLVELMEDPEYVKAKIWLKQNTIFVPDAETEAKKNKAFADLQSKSRREVYNELVRAKEAKDEKGVIDGRVFNEEEIARIKKEQQAEFMYSEDNPLSDKILISFAKRNGIVYSYDFYKGLTTDGKINPEWVAKAKEINELLIPYFNESIGGIDWRMIPNTIEGRAILRKIGKLYSDLDGLKKREGSSNAETVRAFIEANVDDTFTQEEIDEFKRQEDIAKSIGADFHKAWLEANTDSEGKINKYLYHNLRPKAAVAERFTDRKKTEALKTLDELYIKEPTEYYYQRFNEMKKQGTEAFDKWYYENHIYNPRTQKYEPIRCWTAYQYRDNIKEKAKYIAKRSKTTRNAKDEYVNPNYREGLGNALNYIPGTGYDNANLKQLNKYEEELKTHISELLMSLVHTEKAKQWFLKGYLPYQRKARKEDAKFWGKEILATFGWQVATTGKDNFDEIDYTKNAPLDVPMLQLFDQLTPKEDNIEKPVRNENETDASFAERMKKYEEQMAKHREDNRKRHADALNKDWISVIFDFITQVGHYNAVQDNFELLHYGKRIIDDYQVYVRKFGFFGDYKYDRYSSSEDSPDYIMKKDEYLAKQYENYIRRILLNQWKESNEKVTKWAARFQNLTSAQYMMMNIRGGIANVTLGQTQVTAEAHAKAIIDGKSWMKSEALYMSAIPSFATYLGSDKAGNTIDAIIKFFNVIDYDEKLGRARIVEGPASKAFDFFRKAMYSPQSMGEHYMQNRVLIASLLSHKVYIEPDPITGKQKPVFKNRGEVIADCYEQALMSMLDDRGKEEYRKMVEDIKKDPNKAKSFAWYREDTIERFARQYLSKSQWKELTNTRKNFEKKALEDFNNAELHPDVLSQLTLSEDGYMEVKAGSILANFDITKADSTPSDALTAIAALRNRVISVNKKIHGVYDKLGQAQLERKWYGGIAMQYHKHIPIGINKRYRKEGYYNEIRGTVEKGSYVSLIDFLAIPFKDARAELKLTKDEANVLDGIQATFKKIIDFTTHVGLYWNMLPEYEKANIRRNLGDCKGILISILLAIVLKAIGGDDDDDSIPYNLALYEIDRLRSEAAQFTPTGSINEFKKLWSAPIAAQSGLSDLWQSMDVISGMIFGGDEFDPYFRTGRFAGKHKLGVYIERRIPIWRGIKTGFIDINEQNTYYKLRQNVGGWIVEDVLDWTEED